VLLCQSNLGKISQNHDKLSHNFGPMHTAFGEYVFWLLNSFMLSTF